MKDQEIKNYIKYIKNLSKEELIKEIERLKELGYQISTKKVIKH